jgi:hypothetical protein
MRAVAIQADRFLAAGCLGELGANDESVRMFLIGDPSDVFEFATIARESRLPAFL